MRDNREEEKILVIKRGLFDEIGSFQGINFRISSYLPLFFEEGNYFFIHRSKAEENPAYKQIIPYILIQLILPDKTDSQFLYYRRGNGSREERLLGKGSIGIGGHINPVDEKSGHFLYHVACIRELLEEICWHPSINFFHTDDYSNIIHDLAILNDDSTDVGKVHLGIVHTISVLLKENTIATDLLLTPKEDSLNSFLFLSADELKEKYSEMEGWSQIIIQNWKILFPGIE